MKKPKESNIERSSSFSFRATLLHIQIRYVKLKTKQFTLIN